jgi:predicted nucleic acid-binding protein
MAQSGAEPRFTLDTNVLVYSVDRSAGVKHQLAAQILLQAPRLDCWLTLQSLSEFYSVATRKGIMPAAEAAAQIDDWLTFFHTLAVSAVAIRAALADAVAGRASYWDALLVATAAKAGCHLILTEDLQDVTTLSGVEVHNPFAAGGALTARARHVLRL